MRILGIKGLKLLELLGTLGFGGFLIWLFATAGLDQLDPDPVPLDRIPWDKLMEMAQEPYLYRVYGGYYYPDPSIPGSIIFFGFAAFFAFLVLRWIRSWAKERETSGSPFGKNESRRIRGLPDGGYEISSLQSKYK